MSHSSALPLAGIRVLDCSRVLAGPFATMLLADLGADVWKVEPPGGDETRSWGPPFWGDPRERRSAYFASVNRNKRSVVVNLREPAGRDLLDHLAERCDLLVHNYLPATARRLGLDADRLAARHPRLALIVIGGFPGGGLPAERPAYDLLAQAVSGLMAVTGEPDGPPLKVGVAVLDLIAGLEGAIGGLALLHARGAGQQAGQRVEVSLVESGVTSLVNVLGNFLAGVEPQRHGNRHPNIAPYQAFEVRGGHLVVAVGNDEQFERLLAVLGLQPDARFASNSLRLANRRALDERLTAAMTGRARDELLAAFETADVPAAPVASVGEAVAGMREASGESWTREADGIRIAPPPFRIDRESPPLRIPPPRLGAHTDELLALAGISAEEIAALRRSAVVA